LAIIIVVIFAALLIAYMGGYFAGKEMCTSTTDASMSYSDAVAIAMASDCAAEGGLKDTSVCNSVTGTWWLDMDVQREGCNPACVVDVNTGAAEINWRCTGALP
jgi:hypothetical protein